jgi:hypothetical protein
MKNVITVEEVRELVERNNYYFKGNEFEGYFELKAAAEEHFKTITKDYDDQEAYFKTFGLNVGEAHIEKVKVEKYFVEEENATVTVEYYEAYVDSGVNEGDYFHGFLVVSE